MPKNRRPDHMGFRIGFHLMVAFLCAWVSAQGAMLETNDHRDVLPLVQELVAKYGAESVLVAYDYDNTLAASRGYLGSESWFETVQQTLEQGSSPIPGLTTYEDLIGLQHALFRRYPAVLVQPELPQVMAQIQATGARVQVMSSRNGRFFDVLSSDLQRFGISFRQSAMGPLGGWNYEYPMRVRGAPEIMRLMGNFPARKVMYQDGLYLTAGQHKGVALRALLARTGYQPKAILFVDDRGGHLENFQFAFVGSGIETVAVRYTRNDPQRKKYESVSKEQAWQWLAKAAKEIPRDCAGAWALFGKGVNGN